MFSINYFIKKYLDYSDDKFLNSLKNKSFDQISIDLDEYIYFKIFLFNLNDLDIFVQFLYNFSDFILNELYPKKLIYFLPEKIILKIKYILIFLNDSIVFLKKSFNKLSEINNEKKNNIFFEEKNKLNKKVLELTELCWKNYISLLIKIIKDENIKKIDLKCEIVLKLKNDIYLEYYFTDDDIYSIFNFITNIHNNTLYKNYVKDFMRIFEGEINSEKNVYFNFGLRIGKLIKKNKDFLKLFIILLYDNINSSLSKLEERFCEFKLQHGSEQNQNNDNINNDINNNIINNNQDNNNSYNDLLNRMRNFLSFIRRRIMNAELSNEEKFELLEDSFKDTNAQFLILINFYRISADIKQLYEINTFEGKYLNNLLLSLYSILFSSNNVPKVLNSNYTQIKSDAYKTLLISINSFYVVLINNILNLKDDNLLKEIAKQRNLFHFKEILNFLEKYNPLKIDKSEDPYLILKSFIEMLEKIVPEEETIKSININNENSKEITLSEIKTEKNICTICTDSIIDTHILPCEHSICRNCLIHYLSENKVCPFCRIKIEGNKEDPNFKI